MKVSAEQQNPRLDCCTISSYYSSYQLYDIKTKVPRPAKPNATSCQTIAWLPEQNSQWTSTQAVRLRGVK